MDGQAGLSAANWISIVAIVAAAVLATIGGMSRIIQKLLDSKWENNNQRMDGIDDTLKETKRDVASLREYTGGIDRRLAGVEAVCKVRRYPRGSDPVENE